MIYSHPQNSPHLSFLGVGWGWGAAGSGAGRAAAWGARLGKRAFTLFTVLRTWLRTCVKGKRKKEKGRRKLRTWLHTCVKGKKANKTNPRTM